jgi:hypothetical protein
MNFGVRPKELAKSRFVIFIREHSLRDSKSRRIETTLQCIEVSRFRRALERCPTVRSGFTSYNKSHTLIGEVENWLILKIAINIPLNHWHHEKSQQQVADNRNDASSYERTTISPYQEPIG